MKTTHKILVYTSVLIISIVVNFFLARYNAYNEQTSSQCGWLYQRLKTPDSDIPPQNDHPKGPKYNLLPTEYHVQLKTCLGHFGNDIANHISSDICYSGMDSWVSAQVSFPGGEVDPSGGAEQPHSDISFCIDYIRNITSMYGKTEHSIHNGKKVRPVDSDSTDTRNEISPCYCTRTQQTVPSRIVVRSYEAEVQRLIITAEGVVTELPQWKKLGDGEEGDDARRDVLRRLGESFHQKVRREKTLRMLEERAKRCRGE